MCISHYVENSKVRTLEPGRDQMPDTRVSSCQLIAYRPMEQRLSTGANTWRPVLKWAPES